MNYTKWGKKSWETWTNEKNLKQKIITNTLKKEKNVAI